MNVEYPAPFEKWLGETLDPFRLSVRLRIKFFLTGVLLPLLCVGASLPGWLEIKEPWQSGRQEDYIAVLLRWPAMGWLIPFILFSMVGLATWTISPRASRWLVVRLGIYTGAPLSLLFFILTIIVVPFGSPIAAVIVGPLLALAVFAAAGLARRARRFTVLHLMILTTVCAVGAFGLKFVVSSNHELGDLLIVVAMALLVATPTLNAVTYFRAAHFVAEQFRATRPISATVKFAWIAWLTAFGFAMRTAILVMMEEYAKLPMNDPNCYLCGAARNAHACLSRGGAQTRRLKFLELALAAFAPRAHRRLRRAYDRFGPPLARLCGRNRWFASATSMALMPWELLAEAVRATLGIPANLVQAIYAEDSTPAVKAINKGGADGS